LFVLNFYSICILFHSFLQKTGEEVAFSQDTNVRGFYTFHPRVRSILSLTVLGFLPLGYLPGTYENYKSYKW
jgi:hypothetical protein